MKGRSNDAPVNALGNNVLGNNVLVKTVQQARWYNRAWWAGPGRAAVREVLPSYALVLLAAVVLFGGNGLQPQTVVRWVRTSPIGGLIVLLTWVALSSRAYRAAFSDPAWPLLRTFPLQWCPSLVVGGAFVGLVESPWLCLWLVGGSPFEALLALGASLFVAWLWIRATTRLAPRFHTVEGIRWRFGVAVWAIAVSLIRGYTLALLLGMAVWAGVTTLVREMLQRPHEDAFSKCTFGVAWFSLFAVVMVTTSYALLEPQVRKGEWIFRSSPGGDGWFIWSPVAAVLMLTTCFVTSGCIAAGWWSGGDRAAWALVGWPMLWRSVCFGSSVGVSSIALQARLMARRNSVHTPLKALLGVAPLLVAVQVVNVVAGVAIAVASALVAVKYLHRLAKRDTLNHTELV